MFTNVPANGMVSCTDYSNASFNWNAWASKPTATDNCGIPTVAFVSKSNAICSNTNKPTATITWSVTDACKNSTSTTQTITINTPALSLEVDTKEPLCQVGRGGKVTLNVKDGCGPYTYKYSCGNGSVNLTSNVLTGAAKGNYTFTVTDALGCTATTTATIDCLYPTVCTYSQGAFGNPGGMIGGKTTYDQLKALLPPTNPLVVGSLGKTLTLTTAECVDYILPSSGTSSALNTNYTCDPLPTNKLVLKNTLLGQCISLELSVRLPNNVLAGLTLGEICGLTIPTGITGISASTPVSALIGTNGILNLALGGSNTYSKNLGALTKLAGDIIAAYDGCRNPCITAPACPTPAPIVNQGGNLESPLVTAKTINKMADFKVFPVPSDGVVNLDMEQYKDDNIEIKIFNTMSQLVYTQKIQELQQGIVSINLSHFANGAYIISVKTESRAALSKVMIINK